MKRSVGVLLSCFAAGLTINCSGANFTMENRGQLSTKGSAGSNSSGSGIIPAAGSGGSETGAIPAEGNGPAATVGTTGVNIITTGHSELMACHNFLANYAIPPAPVSLPTQIQAYRGTAGALILNNVAGRTVEVSSLAGYLVIAGAAHVSQVESVAGFVDLAAGGVGSIAGVAGILCVGSHDITSIEGAATSDTVVVADHVGTISSLAGYAAIYGATVDRLENVAGEVCLYNGARILSQSGIAGFVHPCN